MSDMERSSVGLRHFHVCASLQVAMQVVATLLLVIEQR